uniref:Hyaluronan and proteoglycan link protein 1a n=1 Tax=Cynoglossus semilaevis TaxID=244447 RepID=A0A3P8VU09_CYNSE
DLHNPLLFAGSIHFPCVNTPLSNKRFIKFKSLLTCYHFPSLSVQVFAEMDANITLPCNLMSHDPPTSGYFGVRVKWTKVAEDESSLNEDVLLSMGFHKKTYGNFQDRAFLQEGDSEDASLTITSVSLEDTGTYRCEIINGMSDGVQEITLEVTHPNQKRYSLNFEDAQKACLDQDAVMASLEQLMEAWKEGLHWCNAGWLSDGSVQYPIINPRGPCGGSNNGPGIRNYGVREKMIHTYDVYCFVTPLKGKFFIILLTFNEAVQACVDDGAMIAKNYDRCDAGWLADGSVRYPISRPRKNCSPIESAVRLVEFPDKTQKSYGVYCYKADQ